MATQPPLRISGLRIIERVSFYARAMLQQFHLRLQIANLVCKVFPDFGSGVLRSHLYRLVGFNIGAGTSIAGNIEFMGGQPDFYGRFRVGTGANIANRVTISLDAEARLGKNVSIGPYVRIYTGTHAIGPGSNRRSWEVLPHPVVIEDGAWIGLGATILPGVTIGHGSVVAAGAVVDQDVPPDSYMVGNPARLVRTLPWGDR
jgi:acetyltransferase-like isoleucine patch superfamily enzyme